MLDWDEMPEKEVYNSTKNYPFTFLIEDNVDYEIHYDITIFMDGTRHIEMVGEYVNILDDHGTMVESLNVIALPDKYRKEAEQLAEDLDL